ncbi:MAG: DUF5054 domain-containing protein, partial [Chloroflexia bacterium]
GIWPSGAKQTDVPGHTWILPSLLVRAGVTFLHLGCNPGSHPPHVPRLFWWEGPDGSRLLTYYSQGGYGTSLLPPEDWDLDTWLALQQTVDNIGPHRPEDLARMRAELEQHAPAAELVFGELGDFAASLLEHPEQLAGLPVVPCDLADTWIHGVGTMPREVARVRALRAQLFALESLAAFAGWPEHDQGEQAGAAGLTGFPLARRIAPAIDAAYEQLMLFGEHTWGLDVKSTIKRAFGPDFEAARRTQPYRHLEDSWIAKAAYVDRAEEALAPALEEVRLALRDSSALASEPISPPTSPAAGHIGVPGPGPARRTGRNTLENASLRVEVDPASGGIVSLLCKRTGREWVDLSSPEPFGGYRYDLYSVADIAEFMRAYGLYFQDWFVQDFGKTGYPEDSVHLTAYARDFDLSPSPDAGSSPALVMAGGVLSPAELRTMKVPEQRISITVSLPEDVPCVDLEYRVSSKVATPLAESAVVPLPLNLPRPAFRLGQTGSVIDPGRDIAAGANRSLWCVDSWLDASDDRAGMGLIPIDMPLVSIGNTGIFMFEPQRVPAEPVIYSHLFNTQWGTNFRQWHEGDFTFRIRLVPHAGDWRYARLWETALHTVRSPLSRSGSPQAPLPGSVRPLRLSDGLVLLSLRPRHDGEGLVLRFWDALGLPREATIELDGPVAAVWRCDLMERPQERLELAAAAPRAKLNLQIAPHAVETLLVEFA